MDRRDNWYEEELLDKNLEFASRETLEDLYDMFSDENNPDDIRPSAEMAAKMKKNIRQEERKGRRRGRYHLCRRAAACAAILLGIGAACIVSVEAWRIGFLNFIVEVTDDKIAVSFRDTETELENFRVSLSQDVQFPEYLPDGFYIEKAKEIDSRAYVGLKDRNGGIINLQIYLNDITMVTEYSDKGACDITINGSEGYLVRNTKDIIIIWSAQNIGYRISGNIAEEELIKVAESIK